MVRHPIAEHADAANRQHYELPPAFFGLVLGPRRKYSCCLYRSDADTLAEAEVFALEETVAHAGLADGQRILELGCGWGSLTLFMAERFPRARIVAVSEALSSCPLIRLAKIARTCASVTPAGSGMTRPSGVVIVLPAGLAGGRMITTANAWIACPPSPHTTPTDTSSTGWWRPPSSCCC